MEHPTEMQIWRLVASIQKLKGNSQAMKFAETAADNLRKLVGTGVFGSLTGPQLTFMRSLSSDAALNGSDHAVAKALLMAFDSRLGYAKLSNSEIVSRTGLSASTVRAALKRLVAAGYFRAIAPTDREWADSDHTTKHEPIWCA
ncbi:hypothetical protein ABID65_001113 [Bradyrhizobium sp. S3.9.2]|uniref:winged helix-turn-helix domain-containing protein n=1 Tax=Bradyrhizobium sp. S3.9.2 TaxID=3156432 RepID=UPI0033933FE1